MSDLDDIWTRYAKKLRQRQDDLIKEVVGGGCDLPAYREYCGKIAMIDEALELARAVRRGDDLRPPPQGEPLRHPED